MKAVVYMCTILLTVFTFYQCKKDKKNLSSVIAETEWFEDYESPENKWGYLNILGETVIPPQFDDCKPFKNSMACVSQYGYWGAIDKSGEWLIQPEYKGLWSMFDSRIRFQNFERKYGFINQEGDVIIPPIYNGATDFHDGLSAVKVGRGYGFINTGGDFVIDTIYESAGRFKDGYAIISKGGKFGVIELDGSTIVKPNYERIKQGENGFFTLKNDKTYSIFNANNYRSINTIKGFTSSAVEDEMYFGTNDSESRIYRIDDHNSILVPFRIAYYAGNNRFIFSKGDHMGLCNSKGEILAEGYDQIQKFSDGRATFLKNELWGYLDKEGSEMIKANWQLCWPFAEYTARVLDQNGISVIDSNGKILFTPITFELRQSSEHLFAFQ